MLTMTKMDKKPTRLNKHTVVFECTGKEFKDFLADEIKNLPDNYKKCHQILVQFTLDVDVTDAKNEDTND